MKSRGMIAIMAVFAASMMLLTPLVPMVADAEDQKPIDVGGNSDIIDIEGASLSGLFTDVLGGINDTDFADGSEISDLLGGDITIDWFKDSRIGVDEKMEIEVSKKEVVKSGSTRELSNGSEYTFKDDGCLVFKSGSVLKTDLNFVLTGVGKTIIIMEEGSSISVLGSSEKVINEVTVDLDGTFAVKLDLPVITDIMSKGLKIEASANLSDNGVISINDAVEIVGNGKDLISAEVNVKLSDDVIAAASNSDLGALKKALFDANDESVFSAKVSIDVGEIRYSEASLSFSGDFRAEFVKTDSDDDECIVLYGKISEKAVDENDNAIEVSVSGSIGITKGEISKFLDYVVNMDTSKGNALTELPKVHASSEVAVDCKYTTKNEAGDEMTVNIEAAKLSFDTMIGITSYGVEIDGDIKMHADSAIVEISGYAGSSNVKTSLSGVDATINLDGKLSLYGLTPLALLSMIEDGSNIVIESSEYYVDDSTDSYSVAVEDIEVELKSVGSKHYVDIVVGSIALTDDVETGSREYMKINGNDISVELDPYDYMSGNVPDIRMKKMSVEIKMIGLDPQNAVLENIGFSVNKGEIHIDEGVVTLENIDLGTSSLIYIEEKAILNSKNSAFYAIVLSEGVSFNGDIYIKCSGYGDNELRSVDDDVNIKFDDDCSNFRLHYSTGSAGNFEIKIVPDIGYELPDWETGLKYDKNGVLTEFDGTLSVDCEPKEYKLTIEGVDDGTYRYGATVILDDTWSGSEITGWRDGTGVIYPAGGVYIMPARDVNLSPVNSMTITSPKVEDKKIVAESDESSLIVPSSTLEKIRGDLGTKQLELAVGDAKLLIDKSIANDIDGDLYFGVETKTIFDSHAVANVVGDNTVYSIRLSDDNGEIHSFPGKDTTVEFSTVYELKKGEIPSTIVLVFLSEDGRLEETKTTVVDNGDGTVLISSSLPHLSDYMVTAKSTGEGGSSGTGMDSIMLIVIVVVVVIAIAAAAFFLLKRKQ